MLRIQSLLTTRKYFHSVSNVNAFILAPLNLRSFRMVKKISIHSVEAQVPEVEWSSSLKIAAAKNASVKMEYVPLVHPRESRGSYGCYLFIYLVFICAKYILILFMLVLFTYFIFIMFYFVFIGVI